MTAAHDRIAAAYASDFGMGAIFLYSPVRLADLGEVLAATQTSRTDDLAARLADAEAQRDAALAERDNAVRARDKAKRRAQTASEKVRDQAQADPAGLVKRISELELALTLALDKEPMRPTERRAVEQALTGAAGHEAYIRQAVEQRSKKAA